MTNQVQKVFIQPEDEGRSSYMVSRGPSIFMDRSGKEDIIIKVGYPRGHDRLWGGLEPHDNRPCLLTTTKTMFIY